ncbi:MAG: YrzE family protein [Chloroflexi bacterium]|nr:YrzE family protein [Chloroflexota bacterium]
MNEHARRPEIQFSWSAIGLGFVAAYAVSTALALAAGAGGLASSLLALQVGGILASFVGGLVAGRRAPSSGIFNGAAVAGVYIFFLSILKGVDEIAIVQSAGWFALPKMDMTGLLVWDLLYLSAGAAGGWIARRR